MAIRPFKQWNPEIGNRVYVDPSASIIGNVTIGDDSSVWPLASIRGDMHNIHIGNRTNIQDNSSLHVTKPSEFNPAGFPLIIGNDVTIGHRVVLHACGIHDRCLIGMGSIILDGALLESDLILAAGSVVPPGRILTSGYLYMGCPVIKKRPLNDSERNLLLYSAQSYVDLKNEYLGLK